jgi:hypothetical protein
MAQIHPGLPVKSVCVQKGKRQDEEGGGGQAGRSSLLSQSLRPSGLLLVVSSHPQPPTVEYCYIVIEKFQLTAQQRLPAARADGSGRQYNPTHSNRTFRRTHAGAYLCSNLSLFSGTREPVCLCSTYRPHPPPLLSVLRHFVSYPHLCAHERQRDRARDERGRARGAEENCGERPFVCLG